MIYLPVPLCFLVAILSKTNNGLIFKIYEIVDLRKTSFFFNIILSLCWLDISLVLIGLTLFRFYIVWWVIQPLFVILGRSAPDPIPLSLTTTLPLVWNSWSPTLQCLPGQVRPVEQRRLSTGEGRSSLKQSAQSVYHSFTVFQP